jgi:hypothetical protein
MSFVDLVRCDGIEFLLVLRFLVGEQATGASSSPIKASAKPTRMLIEDVTDSEEIPEIITVKKTTATGKGQWHSLGTSIFSSSLLLALVATIKSTISFELLTEN